MPSIALLAHRAWNPPTSSSLAEETHLRSLSVHCALHALRLALVSRCLPRSLADEKHVCSLPRPGQRRASLAQHGGARFPTLAARVTEKRLSVGAQAD